MQWGKQYKILCITATSAMILLFGLIGIAVARQGQQETSGIRRATEAGATEARGAGKGATSCPARQDFYGPQQHAQQPAKAEQPSPEKQQQAKEQQKQEPKPQQHATQPAKVKQEKPQKHQQHAQQQMKDQPNEQQQRTQQVKTEQNNQQSTASSHGPQRTQQAVDTQHAQPELRLSNRGSGRIPDDRLHSNFGRGHEFRMVDPVMVDGHSRFQYGGYWVWIGPKQLAVTEKIIKTNRADPLFYKRGPAETNKFAPQLRQPIRGDLQNGGLLVVQNNGKQ